MSRIGKRPVTVPSGIEVSLDGTTLVAKKGNLEKRLETYGRVGIEIDGNEVQFLRNGDDKQSAAFWGTYRALFNNILIGLDKGFSKSLEINGVGYRAAVEGKTLVLQLGFSHPVIMPIPEGVTVKSEKNNVTISGIDLEKVAAQAQEVGAGYVISSQLAERVKIGEG